MPYKRFLHPYGSPFGDLRTADWPRRGVWSIVAENRLLKQQIRVLSRTRRRAPRLSVIDHFLFGGWSLFLRPRRLLRAAFFTNTFDTLAISRGTGQAPVSSAFVSSLRDIFHSDVACTPMPGVQSHREAGSGHDSIVALVPCVALPLGCASAQGFNSLSFCPKGLAQTQRVLGSAG